MPTSTSVPSPSSTSLSALSSRGVPIESLLDACKACSEDCQDQDDVDPYPRGFDVDMDTDMLGSFKGFGRQVVISTGKSDWEREVTDETDSIAQLIRDEYALSESTPAESNPGFLGKLARKFSSSVNLSSSSSDTTPVPGVNPSILSTSSTTTTPPTNLSILNSSFVSSSHEGHKESIMIFPDYKVVHDVESKKEHAKELIERYLSNESGRIGEMTSPDSKLKSWPLPYRAVILLCSHKRRDNRCSIAAPLLAHQFHHHLSQHDLTVDTSGEDLESGSPIEEWETEEKEKESSSVAIEEKLESILKETGKESDRVGVFKVSHIGGHRYAGNVVIHFPNGTCIYYGRVTPADVGVIVERTILNGKVIPEFLRGGLGIDGKTGGANGILDW